MKIRKPIAISCPTGRILVGGLFFMHDVKGFPYGCSVWECKRRGWIASDSMFYCDARVAGWTHDKVMAVLDRERRDSALPLLPRWLAAFLFLRVHAEHTTTAAVAKYGRNGNG